MILEPKKRKSVTVSTFSPSICHEVLGLDAVILVFLNVEFYPSLFTLLFHPHQRLFSSSSLSAIRVIAPAYLRLLVFLPAILIPACDSSSLAFCMIYSIYKLNKQGDQIQPCHTPFPILNQLVVPCSVLTIASWPVHKFLRRQVRWSDILIYLIIFYHSL